jgi:uncharacterized repeat protein (TIGR01451 family)
MPGPDLKDKPLTDTPLSDNRDEKWSDEDDAAYQNAYDQAQQAKTTPTQQAEKDQKNKKSLRAEEWRKRRNQALKQGAKKSGKWAAKTAAKTGAKAGARAGVTAARVGGEAALAGSGAATMGTTTAVAVGSEAAWQAGTRGVKWTKKYVKNPEKIFSAPAEIEKEVEKNTRRLSKLLLIIFFGLLAFLIVWTTLLGGGGGLATGTIVPEEEDKELVISKTGPSTARRGDQLLYTITIAYPNTASDVIVTDVIPVGTQFFTATQRVTCDGGGPCTSSSKTVTWSAKANGLTPPLDTSFTLSLRATQDNAWVVNILNGSVVAAGPVSSGYNPPAPASSCGGKYASYVGRNWLLPLNYGDPLCNFTKEKLKDLLIAQEKTLHPTDYMKFVNFWFVNIVPGESGFNPNAWAAPVGQQAAIDGCGAWGLFQMGSTMENENGRRTCRPAQAPPAPGKNGVYDRGDVNWEEQAKNAFMYNKVLLQCDFWYWSTYRRGHTRIDYC